MPPTSPEDHAHIGGANTHKNPNCACSTCTARRRKAEAIALADGGPGRGDIAAASSQSLVPRGEALDSPSGGVLHAELPPLVLKHGKSARSRVASWIEMKAIDPGITNIEVAKRLGLSINTLNVLLSRARKEGWLIFEDPLTKLEHEIIPKVVDNLNHFLDLRDKTVTIETAKGTIFKSWQESKGISEAPQTVIALKLELPTGGEINQAIVLGKVVGAPRTLAPQEGRIADEP